jgi:predicted metal-dependent HD superfamily phosphohydrolase
MPSPHHTLAAHRLRLAAALGLADGPARAVLDDLAARYLAPDRHYHNLDHIAAVLDAVLALAGSSLSPSLLVAAWFHDAVYDPRAADNEERSAELIRTLLVPHGVAETVMSEAGRLVLLTKTHRCADDDRDGRVLLDADLAVLGEEADTYDAYARAIRREYAWVAEQDYRKGRTRVLENFLGREQIYRTDIMYRAAEERARRNLRREIAALASEGASSPV